MCLSAMAYGSDQLFTWLAIAKFLKTFCSPIFALFSSRQLHPSEPPEDLHQITNFRRLLQYKTSTTILLRHRSVLHHTNTHLHHRNAAHSALRRSILRHFMRFGSSKRYWNSYSRFGRHDLHTILSSLAPVTRSTWSASARRDPPPPSCLCSLKRLSSMVP